MFPYYRKDLIAGPDGVMLLEDPKKEMEKKKKKNKENKDLIAGPDGVMLLGDEGKVNTRIVLFDFAAQVSYQARRDKCVLLLQNVFCYHRMCSPTA